MVNRITIQNRMFDNLPAELQAALGEVQEWITPPQGMSGARVELARTTHGTYALKYAMGALYGSWLAREYRLLSALSPLALPAPRAHALVRRDTGVAPERWLLMDALPGETLSAVLLKTADTPTRRTLLRGFGQILARIHASAVPTGVPRPQPSWLDAMLDEAAENLEHFSVDGTPELLAHLRQTRPQPVLPTLIHGDYTIDNVMVADGRVSGIIDWSGGALGDPRHDLALATRPQDEAFRADREADLQAFYEGYGSPPLSQTEFDYYNGLDEFF
jgi:aminoglycoside phosphotransferase (APT) family kinase protein